MLVKMVLKLLRSNMKKYIIFSLLFVNLGFGQNIPQNFMPQIIQSNPTVSQILKFKETPVSLNTGVSNISIPLYSLSVDNVNIPVNLNYHSIGFRVNEIASNFGLGWSISANSVITRSIKGKPDDTHYGYIFTTLKTNNISIEQIKSGISNNNLDLEPDSFSINLPNGKSIDFMFKQNLNDNRLNVICFPLSDVKIIPIYYNYQIRSFEVIDTDGTKYYFGENNMYDINNSRNYEFDYETGSLPAEIPNSAVNYISTWHLTRVVTAKNKTINYTYRNEIFHTINSCDFSNQTLVFEYIPQKYLEYRKNNILSGRNGSNKVLQVIETDKERIEFLPGPLREDLNYSNLIEKIIVSDISNTKIEEIKFVHDYFISPSTHNYLGYGCDAAFDVNQIYKRLYLKEIKFLGKVISDEEYKYSFDYDTDVILPHRNSFAQDYWGFYNGENDNQDLIPSVFINTEKEFFLIENNENFLIKINNNNSKRNINPTYTKACMLNKITYPEGGYVVLEYENNKIPADTIIDRYIIDTHDKLDFEINTIDNFSSIISEGDYYIFIKNFDLDSKFINEYGLQYESASSICTPFDENGLANIDCSKFNILKLTTNQNVLELNKSVGTNGTIFKNEHFTAGTYTAKIYVKKVEWNSYPANNKPNIWLKINWLNRKLENERYFGGLRIKSIKTYNHDNNIKLSKSYNYNLSTNVSSGKYINFPIMKNVKNAEFLVYSNNGCFLEPGVEFLTINSGHTINFSSGSYAPLINKGNFLSYTQVKEITHDYINNLDKETNFTFSFYQPTFRYVDEPISILWENGNLMYKNAENYVENLVYEKNKINYAFGYDVNNLNFPYNPNIIPSCRPYALSRYVLWSEYIDIDSPLYSLETNNNYLKSTTTISDGITNIQENNYLSTNHLQLTSQINSTSSGDTLETKYSYAHEENNTALISKNMIGIPLKAEVKRNGELLSTQKTDYKDWSNNLLAPEIIKTAKGNQPLEDRIKYNVLDTTNGNPLEIEQIGGIKVCYIWGYNKTQPIAKIENATYNDIQPFEANLQALSNGTDEQGLITALNNLRTALPNAMITTYTYKPLIGISTVTDPKGDKQTYHYDSFNRLQFVKDAQGNILSENQYHYRTQN